MALSKKEIIQDYRAEVKDLRARFEQYGNMAKEHTRNRFGLFLLAQKYLRKHPELLDCDCSGAGLPARDYVSLHCAYEFEMDLKIEEKIIECGYFAELLNADS